MQEVCFNLPLSLSCLGPYLALLGVVDAGASVVLAADLFSTHLPKRMGLLCKGAAHNLVSMALMLVS